MAHHPPTGHSHSHHREMHVAHRRVKHLLASGGYAHGGSKHPMTQHSHKMVHHRLRVHNHEEFAHGGAVYKGHLGRHARGGKVVAYKHGGNVVGKVRGALRAVEAHEKAERKEGYADGGMVHKITPSKRKPHLSVNVFNIHRGHKMMPGGAPMMGGGAPPPLPLPPPGAGAGVGGPPMPGGGPMPMRPPGMKRGGKIQKFQVGGMPMHPLVANRRARLAGAPHVAAARTAARIAAAPHMARAQRAGRMATGLPPQPFKKGGRLTVMGPANSPQLDTIRNERFPKPGKDPSPRTFPEGKFPAPTTSAPTGLTAMKGAEMRHGRRFSGGMGTLEETKNYIGKYPPKGKGK